jgi:tetratricopeptide (TPR) repeat protein
MSFFDRQGIPGALLRSRSEQTNSWQDQEGSNDDDYVNSDAEHSENSEDDTSQSSVGDGFEDDVLVLRNYSFISLNTNVTTLEMHGLVQLATRNWLKAHGWQEMWKQEFIRNLDAELPTGEYENWEMCQALFAHVQSAATQQPEGEDSLRNWASIMYKAAWYAWGMGNGMAAERMSIQSMKVRKTILGREHSDTLNSIAMVGLSYELIGRWEAAEELQVQVMEMSKKKLGADHPDTLSSMANLASTYWNQGRWDAAEELQVQAMEMSKKKLGADHPDTLDSMNNLAVTWSSCRALAAWKPEQERVL